MFPSEDDEDCSDGTVWLLIILGFLIVIFFGVALLGYGS
jgi:hypothetical protein